MLRNFRAKVNIQLLVVCCIALLSLSLTLWWMYYFRLRLDEFSVYSDLVPKIKTMQNMLVSEGITLLVLLLVSYGLLIFHVFTERKRRNQLSQFFSMFTHDLKTSLSSLNLQLDKLSQNKEPSQKFLSEIRNNANRLEVQLENSLLLANEDTVTLYVEKLTLAKIISSLRYQWPELSIRIENDGEFRADYRVMAAILRNLIQNAVIHGKATEVSFKFEKLSTGSIIVIEDNGQGFSGDIDQLGKDSLLGTDHIKSGFGLRLSKLLLKKMNGEITFKNVSQGFQCKVEFRD